MTTGWRSIPIPERMRHLDRDHRGYPIFAMAFRDRDGRPHFTINDDLLRHQMLVEERCSLCGTKLFRGRWFVGGPSSALHPRGAYVDPPMHDECVHYALRVCPYLATPGYNKLIENRKVLPESGAVFARHENVGPIQPSLFVAVLARGQTVLSEGLGEYIKPKRPYMRMEYWRHGQRLDDAEGERIARQEMFVDTGEATGEAT